MNIFSVVPLETLVAIIVGVIAPAITAFIFRTTLNKKLRDLNKKVSRLLISGEPEGIQPDLVKQLKDRYQQASQRLEHVNTIALIESVYQNESITFGTITIGCDRVDGFTRIVPNLLIAFGLIGTFLGITSNLTNISTVIASASQSNPDIGKLVQELQSPLRDMGVAFSTSLFGLIFGSGLTIVNNICNTSHARERLIGSLEDYLDNIYKPTVEGNTRLDKAINRMVEEQKEFLLRFHENVGRVLETSFGRAANQIAQECGRINQVAERVYTNFADAAGTISTGATTFQQAANTLEDRTQILVNSIAEFKSSVETFKTAASQVEKNNIIQNLDRVLAEFTTSQHAFANSTQTLESSLAEITSSNKTAAELAQKVYESWQNSTSQIVAASETIGAGAVMFQTSMTALEGQTQTVAGLVPELKAGLDTFATAANKVKTNNIIKHLNTVVENLGTTQSAFTASTQTLAAGVEEITSNHQHATQMAARIYEGLERTTTSIQSGTQNFIDAARLLTDSSIAIDLNNVANKWQNVQTEFSNSTALFDRATQNIDKLQPTIATLDRAIDSLQQLGTEVVKASQNTTQIAELTQTAIAGFDRNYQKVLHSTDLSLQELSMTNRANWQKLVDILEGKIKDDGVNSIDRPTLARLSAAIERLELILSNPLSRDRNSEILGTTPSN